MIVGRMSNLTRLLGCPGHVSLSSEGHRPHPAGPPAAAWGTAWHHVRQHGTLPKGPLPAGIQEEYDQFGAELAAGWEEWDHEYSVALSIPAGAGARPWTALRFYSDEEMWDDLPGRGKGERWFTGHVDAMRWANGGLQVNDLKTGKSRPGLDLEQIQGYALWAIHYVSGVSPPQDASVHVSITHWPREGWWRKKYLEETGVPCSTYGRIVTLSEVEIRSDLGEFVSLSDRGVLRTGVHCQYCDRAENCPAIAAARK